MPSLMSCPFCGNKDIQFEMPIPHHPRGFVEHSKEPSGWVTGISCLGCGCEMKANVWDEVPLVERWNTRAEIREEKIKNALYDGDI